MEKKSGKNLATKSNSRSSSKRRSKSQTRSKSRSQRSQPRKMSRSRSHYWVCNDGCTASWKHHLFVKVFNPIGAITVAKYEKDRCIVIMCSFVYYAYLLGPYEVQHRRY
jgi:hypothetical protein